jgi:hypothetical protein
MATGKGKGSDRQRFTASTTSRTEVDFELDAEQQKAVIDCIRRNGRLSVRFEPTGKTELPADLAAGIVVID